MANRRNLPNNDGWRAIKDDLKKRHTKQFKELGAEVLERESDKLLDPIVERAERRQKDNKRKDVFRKSEILTSDKDIQKTGHRQGLDVYRKNMGEAIIDRKTGKVSYKGIPDPHRVKPQSYADYCFIHWLKFISQLPEWRARIEERCFQAGADYYHTRMNEIMAIIAESQKALKGTPEWQQWGQWFTVPKFKEDTK